MPDSSPSSGHKEIPSSRESDSKFSSLAAEIESGPQPSIVDAAERGFLARSRAGGATPTAHAKHAATHEVNAQRVEEDEALDARRMDKVAICTLY